jgi:hypothetical protein
MLLNQCIEAGIWIPNDPDLRRTVRDFRQNLVFYICYIRPQVFLF